MGITHVCFGLSYLTALVLELARQARPSAALRIVSLLFGLAGLVAHTIFLVAHQPKLDSAYGSLLLLAWVLAIFYLYGSVHHRSPAWALFVLPVVLVLVALSLVYRSGEDKFGSWFSAEHFWGAVHGILLLAASVGITVGFLASVMYLVQAHRLRMKRPPLGGLRLLSLERLETMSRRAITLAFPLLTVGLLLGAMRMPFTESPATGWTDPKVLGTVGLWIVAFVLLYLRYAAHVPARRLAVLTIAVFGLMLVTLVASHPFASGEGAR
ncbi:MAG TPA: cytochrome c biogenesis protein CcsA [Gemmataceae bacterium]|nr:cytochrome c biogenesis protein CcsA [Gemmataceae bacterium]